MKFNSHDELVNTSKEAQKKWRLIPAPKRGEIIRQFGNELRNQKADLARIITKEARKIVSKINEDDGRISKLLKKLSQNKDD